MRTFTPEEDIPGGLLERQLAIDAWYGEPNRNSQVVKSVDRLASSCRGIERCRLGSSCASGKEKLRSRIKVYARSLDHFLFMHNFWIFTRVLYILLPALSTIDECMCRLQPARQKIKK